MNNKFLECKQKSPKLHSTVSYRNHPIHNSKTRNIADKNHLQVDALHSPLQSGTPLSQQCCPAWILQPMVDVKLSSRGQLCWCRKINITGQGQLCFLCEHRSTRLEESRDVSPITFPPTKCILYESLQKNEPKTSKLHQTFSHYPPT